MRIFRSGNSIRSRLRFIFIFIVLIPSLGGGLFSYNYAKDSLEFEIKKELNLLSKVKGEELQAYLKSREAYISLLAENPSIIDFFQKIDKQYKNKPVKQLSNAIPEPVRDYLLEYNKYGGFYDLFLISKNGDIIFSALQEVDYQTNLITGKYKDSSLSDSFQRSATEKKYYLSDFSYYAPSSAPAAFMSVPLFQSDNHIGTVALQLNARELYSIITNLSGLGDTGEIILATKRDETVEFLTPLRNDPLHEYRKIKMGSPDARPIQKAVSGETSAGVFTDYRGEPVIADWRYIEALDWGMVAKIDKSEALYPVNQLFIKFVLVTFMSVMFMLVVLGLAIKHLLKPVDRLVSTSRKIISGETTARVDIEEDDFSEITELSNSFNELCDFRQAAENSIINSKKELDLLIANAAEGIITIDSKHDIVVFNAEAERLFGFSRDEVINKNLSVLLPEYIRDSHKSLVDNFRDYGNLKISATNRAHKIQLSGLHKDGTIFPFEAGLSKIEIDGGWFFTAFLHDVTERLKFEEDMIQAKELAEQANQAKSAFLANMSHELRTPLHGILSFAHLGLKRLAKDSTEKMPMYFNQIEESGKRLLGLLDNLLDLAKLESGKMVLNFTRQSLNSIVASVIKEQQVRLSEKEMEVVWDNSTDIEAEFDVQLITQVVTNLFSNAIKFNFPASPIYIELHKILQNSEQDQAVLFSLRDEGIGIPEGELQLIFDKFDQSSRTDKGAGGTGLGLAISQEIVEAHGGKIWAENHYQKGAVFKFTLPLIHKR